MSSNLGPLLASDASATLCVSFAPHAKRPGSQKETNSDGEHGPGYQHSASLGKRTTRGKENGGAGHNQRGAHKHLQPAEPPGT